MPKLECISTGHLFVLQSDTERQIKMPSSWEPLKVYLKVCTNAREKGKCFVVEVGAYGDAKEFDRETDVVVIGLGGK